MAESVIQEANQHNNFDYDSDYNTGVYTTIQLHAMAEGGAVEYAFPSVSGTQSGALYAAIVPTDAGGAPKGGWENVRYVRLDGNKLTYFRDGDRYFAAMPVQPLPDGGDASITVTPSSVDHTQGGGISVHCAPGDVPGPGPDCGPEPERREDAGPDLHQPSAVQLRPWQRARQQRDTQQRYFWD